MAKTPNPYPIRLIGETLDEYRARVGEDVFPKNAKRKPPREKKPKEPEPEPEPESEE